MKTKGRGLGKARTRANIGKGEGVRPRTPSKIEDERDVAARKLRGHKRPSHDDVLKAASGKR